MENQNYINPLIISCPTCNQSMDFEIEKDNFKCQFCNTLTPIKEAFKLKLDKSNNNQNQIKQQLTKSDEKLCTCQACGAKIFVKGDQLITKCDFCDSSIFLDDISKISRVPEYYIEFEIDLETAKKNLLDWANLNKDSVSYIIKNNINSLKQYYLPYEIVSGTFMGQIHQEITSCNFNYGGYVDGVAINTSRQTDNLLLDKAEPFDFNKAKVVTTSFFSENNIKFADLDDFSCLNRFKEEVKLQNLDHLRKNILNSKAEITNIEVKDIIKFPMALPMYVITLVDDKHRISQAVVNGQTGQVAVRSLFIKNDLTPVKKRNKSMLISYLFAVLISFGFGMFVIKEESIFTNIWMAFIFGFFISLPVIGYLFHKFKIGKLNMKFDYFVANKSQIKNTKESKLYFMEKIQDEYKRIYLKYISPFGMFSIALITIFLCFWPGLWAINKYYSSPNPIYMDNFDQSEIWTWLIFALPLVVYVINYYFTKFIFYKPKAYYFDQNNKKQKFNYQQNTKKIISPLRVLIYLVILFYYFMIALAASGSILN